LPAEISDLFPDSFEDSELGEIPRGWSISCVNDLCEWVSSGGTPSRSRKDFWENGDIPWFKTGELNDAPLLDSAEKINELALGNSSCKLWDAGTILFAIYASPTVGRLGVLTESGTSNQAAAGLKAKSYIGTPFLRRTLLFSRDELQNIAVGAAQQNINVQVLKEHKVVAPDSSLAADYSNTVSPLDDQQICLAKSTRELCLLRDALLPKLISGEIRIPDAEKMLEEVGI
jgi:type I restriction enzyme S subunit